MGPQSEGGLMKKRYKVICLCGSTKFKREFMEQQQRLTLAGNVVLSVGVFGHSDCIRLSATEKIMLDDIHKQKIWMSDEIFVINKNGYIGKSTQSEIDYAVSLKKPVIFMEENHEGNRSNLFKSL